MDDFLRPQTFDGIGPNLKSDTINECALLRHLEKLQRRAI
jgi:hypothetical protein